MLEHLVKRLRRGSGTECPKTWQQHLIEGEPTALESAFLVYLPTLEKDKEEECESGIIPLSVLADQWNAWFSAISESIIIEQEKPSVLAEKIKGKLLT